MVPSATFTGRFHSPRHPLPHPLAVIEGSISRRPLSEDESQSAISISEGIFVYWSQIGRDERDRKERGSLALRLTWYGFVYTTFGLGASHTRLYNGPWARWAGPGLESPRARPMGFRPAAQARGPLPRRRLLLLL